MKRVMILALALALGAGVQAAAAQRPTEQERRELEQRLETLRRELREIERKLGREDAYLRSYRYTPGPALAPLVYGFSDRPRLGVIVETGRQPTDSVGALLQAVTPDGPAHDAGLRAGDIVTRFRGEALANARPNPGDRLIELAREMKVGDSVAVTYRRGRDSRTTTVVPEVIGDYSFSVVMPQMDSMVTRLRGLQMDTLMRGSMRALERVRPYVSVAPDLHFAFGFGAPWADMELVELNPQLGTYFGTGEGLLVVKAPEDGLLKLRSGDVILRIGGRAPSSPSHAARILRSYEPGDEIRLDIMRDKRRQEIRAVVPREGEGA